MGAAELMIYVEGGAMLNQYPIPNIQLLHGSVKGFVVVESN